MDATIYNFETFQNDTETIEFTVKDVDGVAVNVTGSTVTWVIKQRWSDAAAIITKTTGDGISIIDGNNGIIRMVLSPADTAAVATGPYKHKCSVQLPSGETDTVLEGMMYLKYGG